MINTLDLEIKDHIALVSFNRPQQANSIIYETFNDLITMGEKLKTDTNIRVVILTGQGKHFCAGLDKSLFPQQQGEVDWFEKHAFNTLDDKGANLFQRCATVWHEVPVPVIAAVNGAALGGGCQIALGADIRLADQTTVMSVLEAHWGLIPDMALSVTLSRLLPADVAAELMFTAKKLTAQEALSAGLVTRVSENCLDSAWAMARTIASYSPDAIRAAKQLCQQAWKPDYKHLLKLEADLQKTLIGSKNQIEVVQANLEGRQPRFE